MISIGPEGSEGVEIVEFRGFGARGKVGSDEVVQWEALNRGVC